MDSVMHVPTQSVKAHSPLSTGTLPPVSPPYLRASEASAKES
jgi:hypothetical protein